MKSLFRITVLILSCAFLLSTCQKITATTETSHTPQFSNTPTFSPSSTSTSTREPCLEKVGRVEQRKYQSLLLEKEIWLSVYIPACYEYDDKVRYPVLYLLHGQAYTDDQWIRLGATEVANKFIREGKRRSFLMVMPYEENYLQSNDDSKFTQVIFEELIPWVDVNFHTCPEKKCRSIAGISRGAGWAIRVGLSHPELFESIATHSLPVSTRDIMQISKLLNGIMVDDLPRIWLDSGRSDLFLPGARLFEEVLMENQIPHEFYIYSGYHDEEYWQVHTEDYILWSTLAWN